MSCRVVSCRALALALSALSVPSIGALQAEAAPNSQFTVVVGSDQSLGTAIVELSIKRPDLTKTIEAVAKAQAELAGGHGVITIPADTISRMAAIKAEPNSDNIVHLSDSGVRTYITASGLTWRNDSAPTLTSEGATSSRPSGALTTTALGGYFTYSGSLALTSYVCNITRCWPVASRTLAQVWDQGYNTVRATTRTFGSSGWVSLLSSTYCIRYSSGDCTNTTYLLNVSSTNVTGTLNQVPSSVAARWYVTFSGIYNGAPGFISGYTPYFKCDSLDGVCKWQ